MISTSSLNDINLEIDFNKLIYRNVTSADIKQIKQLHEELFPVKYSDEFYTNTCAGIGMHNKALYSIIIEYQNYIVGFVFAQFIDYPQYTEDKDLFHIPYSSFFRSNLSGISCPSCICYILTLGLVENYRKYGLGSILIKRCAEYAQSNLDCGALYLHVIHTNIPAIKFYEKNAYIRLRSIQDFYFINNKYHVAYLYILYLNGYKQPIAHSSTISTNNELLVTTTTSSATTWLSTLISDVFEYLCAFMPTILVRPENHKSRLSGGGGGKVEDNHIDENIVTHNHNHNHLTRCDSNNDNKIDSDSNIV